MSKNIRTPENNEKILRFLGYSLVTPEMRKRPETWKNGYWERKPIGKGTQVIGTDELFKKETSITTSEIDEAYGLIAEKNTHGFGTIYIPNNGYYTTITKNYEIIAAERNDDRLVSLYGCLIQYINIITNETIHES